MELDLVGVRKKWIKSWKAMLGYQIVMGVLFLLVGLMFEWEGDGKDAISGLILSLWAMLWLFLCRKYAYKKPGTKLLTFILVSSVLGVLRSFAELVKTNIDVYDVIDYAIYMPIFIWFVITSLNLRDLNKKVQGRNKGMQSETVNSTGRTNVYN